jgi:hypothetical protein
MKKIINLVGLLGNYFYGKCNYGRMNMINWRLAGILVLIWLLGACAPVQKQSYLQEYGAQGGRGQGFRAQPYQIEQEVHTCAPGKISGRISRLRVETFEQGMDPLLAVEVHTPERTLVHVHLGPVWYLERHEADLKPGDEIVVKGFCQTLAGRERLMAAEVAHKGQTLQLRDSQGNPVWEDWRNK